VLQINTRELYFDMTRVYIYIYMNCKFKRGAFQKSKCIIFNTRVNLVC